MMKSGKAAGSYPRMVGAVLSILFAAACFDKEIGPVPEPLPVPILDSLVLTDLLPVPPAQDPSCTAIPADPVAAADLAGDFNPMGIGSTWIWSDSVATRALEGDRIRLTEGKGFLSATLLQTACDGAGISHTFRVRRKMRIEYMRVAASAPEKSRKDSSTVQALDTLLTCIEDGDSTLCPDMAVVAPILAAGFSRHRIPYDSVDAEVDPFTGEALRAFRRAGGSVYLKDVGLAERIERDPGTPCCTVARTERLEIVSYNGIAAGNPGRIFPSLDSSWADMAPLRVGNSWEYRDSGWERYQSQYESRSRVSGMDIEVRLVRATQLAAGIEYAFAFDQKRRTVTVKHDFVKERIDTTESSDTVSVSVPCLCAGDSTRCEEADWDAWDAAGRVEKVFPRHGRYFKADSLIDTVHSITGRPGRIAYLDVIDGGGYHERRSLFMDEVGMVNAFSIDNYIGSRGGSLTSGKGRLTRFNGTAPKP